VTEEIGIDLMPAETSSRIGPGCRVSGCIHGAVGRAADPAGAALAGWRDVPEVGGQVGQGIG